MHVQCTYAHMNTHTSTYVGSSWSTVWGRTCTVSGSTSVLLHDQSSLLVKNTKIGHKANLKKTDKLQMRSASPGHQNRLSNCHDALTSGLSSVDSAAVVYRQFPFVLFYFYVLLPRLVWMGSPLVTREQGIKYQRNLDFCFAFLWINVSSWSKGLCSQFFLFHLAVYKSRAKFRIPALLATIGPLQLVSPLWLVKLPTSWCHRSFCQNSWDCQKIAVEQNMTSNRNWEQCFSDEYKRNVKKCSKRPRRILQQCWPQRSDSQSPVLPQQQTPTSRSSPTQSLCCGLGCLDPINPGGTLARNPETLHWSHIHHRSSVHTNWLSPPFQFWQRPAWWHSSDHWQRIVRWFEIQ